MPANLENKINDIIYKPNLETRQVLRKYFTPPLFGNKELAGDDTLDKTTIFFTRGASTIIALSAVVLAGMGVFVGITYILALSPALGVTAGLGSSVLGTTAGIASTLSLTGATIAAIPAITNAAVKSSQGDNNINFEKEIKREVSNYVTKQLEDIRKLAKYGQETEADKIWTGVKNAVDSALDKKFLKTDNLSQDFKMQIKRSCAEIQSQAKDSIGTISKTRGAESITFGIVNEITQEICKMQGKSTEEIKVVVKDVFNTLTKSKCADIGECKTVVSPKFDRNINSITVAKAVIGELSKTGDFAKKVIDERQNIDGLESREL